MTPGVGSVMLFSSNKWGYGDVRKEEDLRELWIDRQAKTENTRQHSDRNNLVVNAPDTGFDLFDLASLGPEANLRGMWCRECRRTQYAER